MYSKIQLVDKIQKKMKNVTEEGIANQLSTLLDLIVENMKQQNRIEIRGLGIFTTRMRNAKVNKNPITGKLVRTPQRLMPFFKPSSIIKKKLMEND